MAYVIKWSTHGYVTRRQPNRKPYAQDLFDPDVRIFPTRFGAERFLSTKDPSWAASCEILPAIVEEKPRGS